MKTEIILKLIAYIDARIDQVQASQSSDGGLIESIAASKLKEELLELISE